MDKASIYNRLTPIFRDVLGDEGLVLTPETSARDVPSWDSVNHIHLVVSIETGLGLKFRIREIAELKTVGDLVELIEKKTTADAV